MRLHWYRYYFNSISVVRSGDFGYLSGFSHGWCRGSWSSCSHHWSRWSDSRSHARRCNAVAAPSREWHLAYHKRRIRLVWHCRGFRWYY